MKGREIIKDVLVRSGIGPKDFFGPSRLGHIVKARRAAAVEMDRAGFTKAAIGRLIHRCPRTVAYHIERARA